MTLVSFRLFAIAGLLIFILAPGFSQTTFYHRYIIEFTDKDNSPYSLSDPLDYLSQRALDRRERYDIPVTEGDLPVNPDYIQQVASTGVKILNRSRWFNSISIETGDSLALAAVRMLPFVKSSEPIGLKQAPQEDVRKKFEEPELKNELFSPEDYGKALNQIAMMEGEALHNNGFRGEGMIIAVLDGGWWRTRYGTNYNTVLYTFDSLYNDNRVLGVWNFVKGTDSVYEYSSHGTQVLSTLASNAPGRLIGTAPEASYYLFLTEDISSEYPIEEHNWAVAAETADSLGVDVISSSLGYNDFTDPSFSYTYADMNGKTAISSRAASKAASKGMLICSSAGNEGAKPWYYITAPADADSIITTGATDFSGEVTSFSSHGPTSDGRIKPTVVAQGIGAWVVDPDTLNVNPVQSNGTSFSNPILAGLATCLWQAHPEKNNMEIIDAITRSASHYFNPNDSFGNGIPNFAVADLILSGNTPADMNLTTPVAYPNPSSGNFGILFFNETSQTIAVDVIDMTGRFIFSFDYVLQAGFNYLPFSLTHIANGSYHIRLVYEDHNEILQIVKADP